MSKRDYYDVLGVTKSATADEIKKAYRKLALQFHPDRNQGDEKSEEKFKEATEAYEVLRDSEKRARFDQFGHAGMSGAFGGGGFGAHGAGFDLSDALRAFMRDFGGGGFGDFFGGGGEAGQSRGPARGRNLQVRVTLTLEEIAAGVEKKIRVKVLRSCQSCGGSGAAEGTSPQTCATCHGTGQVRQVQRSFLGQFVNIADCPACRGEGSIIRQPCSSCRGEGRQSAMETFSVKVPEGVSEGNYIPLRGRGNAGPRGGPAGDLLVMIEEKSHDRFERHGNDLLSEMDVSFDKLVMGDSVKVSTLDGSVKMNIPPGTTSGKVFRLRGKGFPRLQGRGSGDQLVRVNVLVPKKVSKEEKKLLQEMKRNGLFQAPE